MRHGLDRLFYSDWVESKLRILLLPMWRATVCSGHPRQSLPLRIVDPGSSTRLATYTLWLGLCPWCQAGKPWIFHVPAHWCVPLEDGIAVDNSDLASMIQLISFASGGRVLRTITRGKSLSLGEKLAESLVRCSGPCLTSLEGTECKL